MTMTNIPQVLDTKETLAGQQELFDTQDENEEDVNDDVDEEEDDELGSDVEMDDAEAEAEEDDVESESDPGSDAEVDEDEVAAFEAKLAAALGTHRGEDGLNASDGDSSSDEDMNDEQMEELDGKLTEIFKARQAPSNKKKGKKDAREMMVNFKGRVLQLLETFTKHQHSNELVLNLILPLLRLIRTTNTKHIADKSCQIILDLGKQTKGKGLIQLEDADPAWTLLRNIHTEACLGGSNAFGSACSNASLLLAKTLIGHRKESVADIVDLYGQTRKRQLQDKKCRLQPSFFRDWNNWCVSVSQRLRD
jgi:DNA polymerase phi